MRSPILYPPNPRRQKGFFPRTTTTYSGLWVGLSKVLVTYSHAQSINCGCDPDEKKDAHFFKYLNGVLARGVKLPIWPTTRRDSLGFWGKGAS